MNLPAVFSQRDPRWAASRLGAIPGLTIGQAGCYMACYAMLANYYGHKVTPPELNAAMVAVPGSFFNQGNLLTDGSLQHVYDDCRWTGSLYYTDGPADLARLKSCLVNPRDAVILELDFDHDPKNGIGSHFVVAVTCDGEHVTIADPWYGTIDDLTLHYGPSPASVIQKFVLYSGSPASPPATLTVAPPQEVDPMADLTNGQRILLQACDDAGVDPVQAAEEITTLAGLGANAASIVSWIETLGADAAVIASLADQIAAAGGRKVKSVVIEYDDGTTETTTPGT